MPGRMAYKEMMFDGIPNLAFVVGYPNASWTLKADLVSEYVCRLLAHMDAHGYSECLPELTDPSVTERPLIHLTSGFVQRAGDQIPTAGSKAPWRLRMNYVIDARTIRRGPIEDGTLRFSAPAAKAPPREPAAI